MVKYIHVSVYLPCQVAITWFNIIVEKNPCGRSEGQTKYVYTMQFKR